MTKGYRLMAKKLLSGTVLIGVFVCIVRKSPICNDNKMKKLTFAPIFLILTQS